jgi:hypothetical protein
MATKHVRRDRMSDAKLRGLERRWRETGAVEDEAAYVLERMRVGDLRPERVELAAYCGHAGARAALGPGAPAVFSVLPSSTTDEWDYQARESFRSFLIRVAGFGGEAFLHAALAAGWFVLPVFERIRRDPRPREALEVAEACLLDLCAQNLAKATAASAGAAAAQGGAADIGDVLTGPPPPRESGAADLASYVCQLAATLEARTGPDIGVGAVSDMIEMLGAVGVNWSMLAGSLAQRVASWALGPNAGSRTARGSSG